MTEQNINNGNSTMNEHETIGNVLSIEVFLNERYAFRHNVLSGKTEFAKKAEDGTPEDYRVLTQKALNSISIQAKLHLAQAMRELGYESKDFRHSAQYYAIPLAA